MTAAAAPPRPAVGRSTRRIVTICSMIATLMQALDNTIANVALPYMQGTFSTTPDQITWVLTAYVITAAILTAPIGWLSQRFGRRRFFTVSVAGFTAASMLCGMATTLEQMVLFRLLQGAFGAALVPLSQAVMLDLYAPEERGRAMAMWGMGVMIGPILGPTLGGYLTDAYDWRWVFFINLPFGLVAMAGLWLLLEDQAEPAPGGFDWFGFTMLSLGLGGLQLMLDRGQHEDWFNSTEIIAECVVGCLGMYLFAVHIMTAEKPFIPRAMFTDRNYLAAFVMMFMMGLVLLASSALLPTYVQVLGGYSVTQSGLLMAPRGVGTMIAMMLSGRLVNHVDARALMLAGVAMLSFSMWQMAGWTPDIDPWSLSQTMLLQGIGLGFVFIPMQVVAYITLASAYRTDGAALLGLTRNIGSAIGISITSVLLAQNTQIMHARLTEGITPFNRMAQTGGAYLRWNLTRPSGRYALNEEITRQASIVAYANDFMFLFVASVATALCLLLMRRPKEKPDAALSAHMD